MCHHKYKLILIISLCWGQSNHNANGLGQILFNHNAASLGTSSRGLVSAYNNHVSMSNPATWQNLKFAFLSSHYNANETIIDFGKNGNSGLSNIQFAVPIGNKYAWGFGIRPMFNQQYLLEDGSEEFYLEGDTLLTQRFMDGAGGLASFYTAISLPLTEKEGLAIELDILFGSFRKNITFMIDQRSFLYFQRHVYSGSLWKLFLSSNRFYLSHRPVNIHFMLSGAFNPLFVKKYSFQPFEDLNNNGFYDSADKPSPSVAPNAEIASFQNVLNPREIGLGIDVQLNNDLKLLIEGHQWEDNGEKFSELFSLNSLYINKSQQLSVGVAKFSPRVALTFGQKIQYRGGVYIRKDQLASIDFENEMGFSLGIGIKFGIVNNQIDLSFKRGFRESEFHNSEMINEFMIGIQLGDVWFVKRRPK